MSAARRFVRELLRDHSRETVDAAELMTSELATNCVQHAHTDFELTIDLQDQIRVEVRDTGRGRPLPRSPTPREPSGRGLRIVEAMSSSWGIIPSSSGKTVWFTLAAQPCRSSAVSQSVAASGREVAGGDDPDPHRRGQRKADAPDHGQARPRAAARSAAVSRAMISVATA